VIGGARLATTSRINFSSRSVEKSSLPRHESGFLAHAEDFSPSRLLVMIPPIQASPPGCLRFHSPPGMPDVSRPLCRAKLLGHGLARGVETNLVLIAALKLLDREPRGAGVRACRAYPAHFSGSSALPASSEGAAAITEPATPSRNITVPSHRTFTRIVHLAFGQKLPCTNRISWALSPRKKKRKAPLPGSAIQVMLSEGSCYSKPGAEIERQCSITRIALPAFGELFGS